MTATIVWLASYPKSGNTWVRAIITALSTDHHVFGVNQLGFGSQPHHVRTSLTALGLDSRWLDVAENDQLRDSLIRSWAQHVDECPASGIPPLARKTHEIYRPGPAGMEPFPSDVTQAAILIVRDPRDVACSMAPYFGMTLDEAIDAMGSEGGGDAASPINCRTAQPWGTWSTHARSWLSADVPFPVHVVRYEDLHDDPVEALGSMLADVGVVSSRESLAQAVEACRFERLQISEAESGFGSSPVAGERFFRQGKARGWVGALTERQVATVEADHAEVMAQLGYDLASDESVRRSLVEARASNRRLNAGVARAWPGLSVEYGSIPTELPNATRPRPWIQVSGRAAQMRFAGGAALLVEAGTKVTLDWPEAGRQEAAEISWLVEGWAMTLVALQRGNLSLHAATVDIDGRVTAIAGSRGAGKSTTAMGLRGRGHQLLVDDVTILDLDEEGAWVRPFVRNVHLTPDAAARLGVDFETLPLLAGGRSKAAFRPEDPPLHRQRIDRIVVLEVDDSCRSASLARLEGLPRFDVLRNHLDRDGVAPLLLGAEAYFALATRLANQVSVDRLVRPTGTDSMQEVLDLIERGKAPFAEQE